jgi:hypothetical protein
MSARFMMLCGVLATAAQVAVAQADVQIEKPILQGPRALQPQTQTAVIKNYLESWQTLRNAFDQNRLDLLDKDFLGIAHDKLAATIQQQLATGVHTRYQDKAHDIQIVFYSPEGLSVELTDTVDYDVQVLDHDKVLTTQHARSRYIAVLTPTEVRWRVRVFQAQAE